MHFENVSLLQRLGLSSATLQSLLALAEGSPAARPARVLIVHRGACVVHDGCAQLDVRVHPNLAATAIAVGDWVLLAPDVHGALWLVTRATPVTEIVRRDADGLRHVVVSNVDVAFIVMGLDGDFNPRRAERFIALALGGGPGITPVLVLTKRDWAGAAVADDEADAMRRRLGIAVEAVNSLDPGTAPTLARYIAPGQTAVLLGSSGAGKSTLTNTLVGASVEDTGAVRAADDRGKHTTTHRALYLLPQSEQSGGCIIDTPGVRTLRPDVDAQSLGATFKDIEALAAQCRFRDCHHQDEPGCAVRGAVDADRLRNWHKLGRELRRDAMTMLDRQRQLAEWKARSRGARERVRLKRGAD